MKLKYSMLIQWSDGDRAHVVTLPEFPYCMAHGETYAEAARIGEVVLQTLIDTHAPEHGELPLPNTYDLTASGPSSDITSIRVAESRNSYSSEKS